jgi:hypothetical protein
MKLLVVAVVVVALGVAAWSQREAAWVRQFMPATEVTPVPLDTSDRSTPERTAAPGPNAGSRSGLRKCLQGGQVTYTNGTCPDGSREQSVTGGTVTVMPGQSTFTAPKLPALPASVPNARQLIAPHIEPTLREQQQQRQRAAGE